jgi:hypothetical protein
LEFKVAAWLYMTVIEQEEGLAQFDNPRSWTRMRRDKEMIILVALHD